MIERLLTLLALTLPLAACAAQPVDGPAAQQAQQPASPQQATRAAPSTAPADAGQSQATASAQAPAAAAPSGQAGGERARSRAATAATVAGPSTATSTSTDNNAAGTAPAAPLGSTPVQETPAALGTVTVPAPAPAPAPGPVTMPAGSATGSLLQTLFALIVVLAVLALLAWFLKRYGPKAGGGSANLRIVGSLNLGGRERLLVVEVGNQWIVVGASPGRVNALATMPKQEGIEGTAALAQHAPSANSFADWLKQTIDKRK
jgi:flagellar biosynthetic protein FliO